MLVPGTFQEETDLNDDRATNTISDHLFKLRKRYVQSLKSQVMENIVIYYNITVSASNLRNIDRRLAA